MRIGFDLLGDSLRTHHQVLIIRRTFYTISSGFPTLLYHSSLLLTLVNFFIEKSISFLLELLMGPPV